MPTEYFPQKLSAQLIQKRLLCHRPTAVIDLRQITTHPKLRSATPAQIQTLHRKAMKADADAFQQGICAVMPIPMSHFSTTMGWLPGPDDLVILCVDDDSIGRSLGQQIHQLTYREVGYTTDPPDSWAHLLSQKRSRFKQLLMFWRRWTR